MFLRPERSEAIAKRSRSPHILLLFLFLLVSCSPRRLGVPAVDFLAEALYHPEIDVREHAILALGRLRDLAALSALREIANQRADREFSALARELLNAP